MNKIEQLIEKYKPFITSFEKIWNNLASWIVEEFIKDLQSLQDTTDERECNNCKKLQKELDWISFSM